jgi:succinate dehydrogenase / fumarate reductase membrane anchor subunit
MLAAETAPKSREGAWLWLIKIVTGLLIIVILGIHFVVNHFIGENALLSYADVVRYYSNPIIPVMEGFFLVFVVSHSLLGLRSIILDLKPSHRVLKVVDWVLTIVGVVSIVYGIWLILAILNQNQLA